MMENNTNIRRVKLYFAREDQEADKEFEQEVRFYTKMKSKAVGKGKDYEKRLKSCDPTQMFEHLLKLAEDNERNYKMPVRKFFNNTFDTLLNQAFFNLKKEQDKNPDNNEYFTTEGQIKFVAFYLLDNLPDGEVRDDAGSSMGDSDR